MNIITHCPDSISGAKTSCRRIYLLLLFAACITIQGCKLDPPIIPDSLLHPKPIDTSGHVTPPPIGTGDTIITDTITPAAANFGQLKAWNAYKANPSTPYDMLLIGDSYTQGNFYTWRLRTKLILDGFVDGGPGYDSFGRYDPVDMGSIDGSMEPDELTFTYDPLLWDTSKENYWGPCGNVTNNTPNALITVISKVPLSTMIIIYERHANAGDFRYRVNGGVWTTVDADAPVDGVGNIEVDVSNKGSKILLDIQALNAGEVFCGVLGHRDGTGLTLHKLGSGGTTASFFANNDLWEQSVRILKPNGATIMFGTNEMNANISPDDMKESVQHIINRLRDIQPNCDIVIMCPPETTFENEDPRNYKIAAYADMLFKLSLANHAAYIDFAKVFPHFSEASITAGLILDDRIHPGIVGSELIATTIFNRLKKQ